MLVRSQKAVGSLFEDVCTVYEQTETVDEHTHRSRKTERETYADIPCRLSFSGIAPAQAGEGNNTIVQSVKLFTAPDIMIRPGSRIRVVRATGAVSNWKNSGIPASYQTHCEYMLEPLENYA